MECSICLNDTQFTHNLRKPKGCNDTCLKCNHVFHRICIKKWFLKNDTCPICRQEMKFKEGMYFKALMFMFQFRKYIHYIIYDEICDGVFIYHDNASLILFINSVKQNALHTSHIFNNILCKNQTGNVNVS